MIKFLGNTNHIFKWDDVIAQLEKCGSETHPGPFYGPTHKEGDDIPLLDEITNLWKENGYKAVEEGGTVQWDMFFPGVHFDQSIVDKFIEVYELKEYNSAWISRVHPGRMAPIHWDINDNEEQYYAMPDKERWHVHISRPAFGHAFVLENELLANRAQGDVFWWSTRRLWHSGMNMGLVPKYQFNIW